ncbi:MAG TPA: antitoxin, RHH family protein [Deltaproteobacteria bacterium]|nr:antitoxin, RHH family protein [Deltaproteobacteria bacterium]
MPRDKLRLNIVLEKPLHRFLSKISKRDGASLSSKARDLIREALELQEDLYWERKAKSRAKTFHSKTALTHQAVWK